MEGGLEGRRVDTQAIVLLIQNSDYDFISQLNTHNTNTPSNTTKRSHEGEGKMKTQTAPQKRKKLQQKLLKALSTEMHTLRKPLQKILTDDLVTAFENRISVFHAYQQKISQKRG
jgi:hypothetical protein